MPNERIIITAEQEDEMKRLDQFLVETLPEYSRNLSLSRASVQKLILEGAVTIDGKPTSKNHRLKSGEGIIADIPDAKSPEIIPQDIPLDIVYEDSDLIVVNKPKGMVVHPAPGHYEGTLVNALMFHCRDSLSGINGVLRPGIVHRIDKDTSGLLVVAKNDNSHRFLADQLAVHSMTRQYMAVVHGTMKDAVGTIDMPIGRSEKDRTKYEVMARNSKSAVTHYEILEQYEKFALLSLRLQTGRTHQIRVHMSSVGHPVAGDTVYGPKSTPKELKGQCLHAKVLGFVHPSTGERMLFDSELPEYFTEFIRKVSNKV